MSQNLIANQIQKKLESFDLDNSKIAVLKGIPLDIVDPEAAKLVDLAKVVENKAAYLFINIIGKRKFITYEEFLLLKQMLVDQYKTIYILNNNIYIENYPINPYFSDDIRKGLLNHYMETDDENEDEAYIGDISEYIAIYNGIKEYNGYLLGVYCDDMLTRNEKIENINLFDDISYEVESRGLGDSDIEFFDILDEADYIHFVKLVFEKHDEIYVRISNYSGDKLRLKNHINLLASYWQEWTDIIYVQAQTADSDYDHREEYKEILKKYWGYEEFRNLPVYDMMKLENDEKLVKSVSQEEIISNIVKQVENCGEEDKNFRDIFVTAPTGAGKSVMFQIPAIYLAEKYELLTIVISPLIGLMNDQVKNLEVKNYHKAKTINSDISPIIKQDIIDRVAYGEYHILYISPETLLSRSDVEQLIGDRKIGMIVIDEAHIVTTWGKQFRPDYWYLGDHIKKLRKKQLEKHGRSMVIATFTATAIYHGVEDMYTETVNGLHMIQPKTYLGYVKRNDIDIRIEKKKKEKGERSEYEYDKFEDLLEVIKRSMITNKKTLIYFPTVALIDRFYEFCKARKMLSCITKYHGSLDKSDKLENYELFLAKEKSVMLATKAFGMGIDIDDIELVVHFAPTGNVCDYVQEIGRAARRKGLIGEAYFNYNTKDFKHINRLHGLSTIQSYQIIEVVKKIDELYTLNLHKGMKNELTRKRNAMLIDAENFSYIFGTPISDEGDNINKVKTALLIIQKDFENKVGFSPINVRPIPLFSIGFFQIEPRVQNSILQKYPGCVEEIDANKHICRVLLDHIWKKSYKQHSFPKFKYMIYSKDKELDFTTHYTYTPALCVDIEFCNDYQSEFYNIWNPFKAFINKKVLDSTHTAVSEIVDALRESCRINKYKTQAICEVILASMDSYRRNFAKSTTPIAIEKSANDGSIKYQFNVAVNSYFNWVEAGLKKICNSTENGKLYLINDNGNKTKESAVILGILEAFDVLSFKMLGGANSQLYIYINQIQSLRNILQAPYNYKNRLLETVSERHTISVQMLTYLYENKFSSEERWDLIEDYFLGEIPEKVKKICLKLKPDIVL